MLAQCKVAVLPMYFQPDHKSEMVSQMLYGETCDVLERTDAHSLIKTHFDQTEGWVENFELQTISELPKQWVLRKNYQILSDENQKQILLSIGSEWSEDADHDEVQKSLSETALGFLNVPFISGGRSFFGIDASALVQLVFKVHGHPLPRFAGAQSEGGEALAFIWEAEAGDLAFFDDENGEISHVGIMLNNEEVLHAFGKVRIDLCDSTGIFNKNLNKYTHKLRFIKRVL